MEQHKGQARCCGAGIKVYLSQNHIFKLKLGARIGTNNIVELLALWGLLYLENYKKLRKLQVVGDFKLVVDWFNIEHKYIFFFLSHGNRGSDSCRKLSKSSIYVIFIVNLM